MLVIKTAISACYVLNFQTKAEGESIMKKILGIIAVLMIMVLSLAYAGGDQNHGSEGQGSTGSDGQGQVSQNSRN
jgi:hypothetical protein